MRRAPAAVSPACRRARRSARARAPLAIDGHSRRSGRHPIQPARRQHRRHSQNRRVFEDALARVRRGRDHDADVPRGPQFGRHRTFDGARSRIRVHHPQDYDASRPYQVRFQLHGGIARARPAAVNRVRTDVLPSGVDEILVFPIGWVRVALVVGDAGRQPRAHPRSAEAHLQRRREPRLSDGRLGWRDRRVFHGVQGRDAVGELPSADWPHGGARHTSRCWPRARCIRATPSTSRSMSSIPDAIGCIRRTLTQIYVEHLRRLGGSVVFRVYPELDHSTEWWPNDRPEFESFVHDNPREPLPDRISWQTERVDRFNRAHWLIIDRLGSVEGESRLPDTNLLPSARVIDFGLRVNPAVDSGRRVHEVVAGSNAFRIGLRAGDRLVEVNGKPVAVGRDIAQGLETWTEGDSLKLVVERRGDRTVLEGVFQPEEVDVPPAPIFPRRQAVGAGRSRAARKCRGGVDRRRAEHSRCCSRRRSSTSASRSRSWRTGARCSRASVEPSVATLLQWAARDNDRTMVFGAELKIELGK